MNKVLKKFIEETTPVQADNILIKVATIAMGDKLRVKRNEGWSGWHSTDVEAVRNKNLLARLKKHIDKGDMIDVMNFAAMIHVRKELYGDDA